MRMVRKPPGAAPPRTWPREHEVEPVKRFGAPQPHRTSRVAAASLRTRRVDADVGKRARFCRARARGVAELHRCEGTPCSASATLSWPVRNRSRARYFLAQHRQTKDRRNNLRRRRRSITRRTRQRRRQRICFRTKRFVVTMVLCLPSLVRCVDGERLRVAWWFGNDELNVLHAEAFGVRPAMRRRPSGESG